MTEKQENKFSTYLAVQKVLQDHTAICTSIPAFAAAVGRFDGFIDAQIFFSKRKITGTRGATDNKADARKALIEVTVEVQGLLIAYANVVGDNVLSAKLKMTESAMGSIRDSEFLIFCQLVWDEANTLGATVADYGIGVAERNSLQYAINAYRAAAPGPKAARASVTVAVGNIKTLQLDCDSHLELRLDKFVTGKRKTNPDFYGKYNSARKIDDNRGPGKGNGGAGGGGGVGGGDADGGGGVIG